MPTLKLYVTGHDIQVAPGYNLAQGSNLFDTLKFEFDAEWNGYKRFAVVYISPNESVYKIALDATESCKLPNITTDATYRLYIGLRGEKSDGTVATSTVVPLDVSRGAIDGIRVLDIHDEEWLEKRIREFKTLSMQSTEPTDPNVVLWINSGKKENFKMPEVKDGEINPNDTWSSRKISEENSRLSESIDEISEVLSNEIGTVFPTWEYGNISSAGESSTKKVCRTKEYIQAKTNEEIVFSWDDTYFKDVRLLMYKYPQYDEGGYRAFQDLTNGEPYKISVSDVSYIRIRMSAIGDVDVDLAKTATARLKNVSHDKIDILSKNVEEINSNLDFFISGVKDEIFSLDELISNSAVIYTNGTFLTNAQYKRTDFIEIPKGCDSIKHTFPFSGTGTDGWAIYDEQKQFVIGGRDTIIKCDSSYKYFAISCRTDKVTEALSIESMKEKDNEKPNKEYNIVMLGDSIIGNYNGNDSVPAFLAEYSGANCFNCAFGGSTMGADTTAPHPYIEAFNGFKIVNAIVTNDYSEQEQAIAQDTSFSELKNYFQSHINTLKAMDWNAVDVVTMSFGTNDWGTRVVLENVDNDHDTNSFIGAYRTAIETLLTKYPHIKIVIASPIWRGIVTTSGVLDNDTDTDKCTREYLIEDYREKAKEVAEQYHAVWIDAHQNLCFNRFTWKNYFPLTDATHPNATGRKAIAKLYAEHLARI